MILYILFRFWIFSTQWIPMHIKAGIIHFLIAKVFKYRYSVVYQNISWVFPEKSDSEKTQIVAAFYRHLSTLIAESVYISSYSKSKLNKAIEIQGKEYMLDLNNQGKSVMLFCGHFGNWELAGLVLGMEYPHPFYVIYKNIRSPFFNQWMMQMRSRFGNYPVPMEKVYRVLKNQKGPSVTCVVADQTPPPHAGEIYSFFGHPTYFIQNAAMMAQRIGSAIVYGHMHRNEHGKYFIRIEVLTEDASKESVENIMKLYIQIMEEDIRAHPENWLWSHRRWKRNKDYRVL